MAPKRTPQRANAMLDRLAARTLAAVPDTPAAPEPVAAEPATTRTTTTRTTTTAKAMPAEQPKHPRRAARPATPAASDVGSFPHRITQTMSYEQSDALDEIRAEENRKLRAEGHEQVYTVTGLIRAAVFVCLSDPKLTARMIKAAGEPHLSGRGGIGTRR